MLSRSESLQRLNCDGAGNPGIVTKSASFLAGVVVGIAPELPMCPEKVGALRSPESASLWCPASTGNVAPTLLNTRVKPGRRSVSAAVLFSMLLRTSKLSSHPGRLPEPLLPALLGRRDAVLYRLTSFVSDCMRSISYCIWILRC